MKTEFKQRQIHARKLYGHPRQGRCWKGLNKVKRAFQILEEVYSACRPAPQKKLDGFANLAATTTSKTKVDSNFHANEQFITMMDIEE